MTPQAIAVLEAGLRAGVCVAWGPPCRFRGPQELLAPMLPHEEVAREVLRRAVIFRVQLAEPGPAPVLCLPDVGIDEHGACISCGVVIPEGFRCPLCRLAAWLALDLTPPSESRP